ncbi:PREDICTED: uncharacterized protein LOC106311648 isoform X1 [Brassica oleracea var. oleracea]|uniref:uncharacterized protein LOC106311648 isoform X1 n=1 Tax=Brassica oleracea var. oleracea TaxID=109376 RepID=UPI0006A6F19A|nr:PREDICTED: uncharacterized protein LOC106311648 isoform X1 [Brassica oleracea var. oleracea]
MAEQTTADPTFSPALVSVSSPSPPKKQNTSPVDSKLTELNESRAELLNRILNLKQDLQSWRGKLDTQVQVYREELSGLKKTLNLEVEQLREQQDDVSASLKTPGLQDDSKDSKEQMVTGESGSSID